VDRFDGSAASAFLVRAELFARRWLVRHFSFSSTAAARRYFGAKFRFVSPSVIESSDPNFRKVSKTERRVPA
jgi:hypothetical protein